MHDDDLIRRHFWFDADAPQLRRGPGDDAAVLDWPVGRRCALSSDLFLEGAHFDPGDDPADIGHKALAVNLSDLAAMGARPVCFTLALALPAIDDDWLTGFSAGLRELARTHDCVLAGGDVSRGALGVCITVLGALDGAAPALRRDAGRAGDRIGITGDLGGAAYARRHPGGDADCRRRLHRPEPRVAFGRALRGLARAAIDVSDGLLLDLGRLLAASGCGGSVALEEVPLPAAVAAEQAADGDWVRTLGGGEDYELLFTAPAAAWDEIEARAATLKLPVRAIGRTEPEPGLRAAERGRTVELPERPGFDHFATG